MKRGQTEKLAGQLDLFSFRSEAMQEVARPTRCPPSQVLRTALKPAALAPTLTPAKSIVRPTPPKPSIIVREGDIPLYDADEIALVDATIAEMPPSKLWFTYQDIQRLFGVSRATVARKVKAGLVPGIRFADGRVVEEGAVRRFSRTQIRFVLLAVRRRDAATAAS